MAHEVWRDIPGFEEAYQVSDHGRVRVKEHWVTVHRKNGTVYQRHRNQRLLKPIHNTNGYVQVTIHRDGVPYQVRVHRLVMLAFVGPSDLQVNHKDENKTNNHLENLEYMAGRDNMRYTCCKPVESYDLVTGETIKRYDSMHDAAVDGHDGGAISNVVLKKYGFKSHHGLGWRLADVERCGESRANR